MPSPICQRNERRGRIMPDKVKIHHHTHTHFEEQLLKILVIQSNALWEMSEQLKKLNERSGFSNTGGSGLR